MHGASGKSIRRLARGDQHQSRRGGGDVKNAAVSPSHIYVYVSRSYKAAAPRVPTTQTCTAHAAQPRALSTYLFTHARATTRTASDYDGIHIYMHGHL